MTALSAKAARRAPKIVLVTATKGGVGKSTLCAHLACSAAAEGLDVCGLDFDTQHNLARWANRRRQLEPLLPKVTVYQGRLEHYAALLRNAENHDIAFIDTPPASPLIAEVIDDLARVSDFILVPTRTGIFDIETVVPYISHLHPKRRENVSFVMNMTSIRSAMYKPALKELNAAGRVHIVPIPLLASIERAAMFGRSIIDPTRKGIMEKGADDFESLWDFVKREVAA